MEKFETSEMIRMKKAFDQFAGRCIQEPPDSDYDEDGYPLVKEPF